MRSKAMLCVIPLMLAACADQPGEITRDTAPFSSIAKSAEINLLGTEPFWSLDIAPEGSGYIARYSTPENIDGSSFPVTRFAGNNGLGFDGELDGGAVQVSITRSPCSDGMSDRTFPYSVIVQMGEMTLRGCGYTSDEPFTGDESP